MADGLHVIFPTVRFQNQYVTSKILEHEWVTRGLYGLPDNLSDAPEYPTTIPKSKIQKPKKRIDTEELRKKNTRKFSKMFSINQGPRWDPYAKEPLMEGKDRIVLETEDGKGGVKWLLDLFNTLRPIQMAAIFQTTFSNAFL